MTYQDTDPTQSCRDLAQLEPAFRAILEAALADANALGLCEYRVIETYRSQERQDWLYAQGRSRGGDIVTWTKTSRHTSRLAADVAPFIESRPAWDRKDLYDVWGEIAVEHGLVWGGHFRNYDGGHVQAAWA